MYIYNIYIHMYMHTKKIIYYLYYISLKWPLSCPMLCCPVLFTIGGQADGPIGLKIGTHTHWNNAMKIGGSAIASAHLCERNARKCARSTTYPA
jgi:hypothetical protein